MAITQMTGDAGGVTSPTGPGVGGSANFNIADIFKQFGYYPTQAEVDALSRSFSGKINPLQIGTSAVAQYVIQKQAEAERHKNDPLVGLQTKMSELMDQQQKQITGFYGDLKNTLAAAPQLFGSLSPEQIQTYLQPLKNTFDQQIASVQGAIASRGLAGSSTENNALAQTNQRFQEQVLSSGLQVGLDAQKNKAAAIQAQIDHLFGLIPNEQQVQAGAAKQQSAQDLGQSQLISSLPSFLNSQSFQDEAIEQANASKGGFQDRFNQVTGDISTGLSTAGKIYAAYQTAGASTLFSGGGSGSPPPDNRGGNYNPNAVPSSTYGQNQPNLNAPGYGRYYNTGSLFE